MQENGPFLHSGQRGNRRKNIAGIGQLRIDQVGIPALVRAFKEKAPFWVEKMPELPELVYDSLRQGKYLQHSVDKIARELQSNHVRQGQSRYFLGIGATLVLSGTFLLVSRPEWGLMPGWLMAGGLIAWFVGWRKTR